MARRPRNSGRKQRGRPPVADDETTSEAAPNTFAPEKVEQAVDRIEDLHSELEKEKSEYMLRCKDVRADVQEAYDDAKDQGISKAVLKAKIKERALRKKVANCRNDLEAEQIDMFDQISSALKDIYDDVPRTEFTAPPTAGAPFAPAA